MMLSGATRIFQSPNDGHYFFGYFNTPQISADETKILALRCSRIDRVPNGDDLAEVGWFDLTAAEPTFHVIGETTAFNWQQGCMLQFLGPDYDRHIIYNRFDGTDYVADIVDLITGDRRTIAAIYNMFPDGRTATVIDFARHSWCRRGYSYGNLLDASKNQPVVPGDGVWSVDIGSGARTQIIALEDLLRLRPLSSMEGAVHYLEHMTACPAGIHFAFLHRWRHSGGIHSRLLVAKRDGTDVRIINDSGRMSHFCWRDADHLFGYGGIANPLNKLRRNRTLIKTLFRVALPIYRRFVRDNSRIAKSLTGDAYLDFNIRSGRARMVLPSMRAEDGHPVAVAGTSFIITDTYARSEMGQQPRLFLCDLETSAVEQLDELRSISELDESPLRCDLHPRVSPTGTLVSIDTMDSGMRGIYAYRLGEILT